MQPEETAQLVLAPCPSTLPAAVSDPYYLVPAGDFTLSAPQASVSDPVSYMPGLSAVEFVGAPAASEEVRLRLIPGCAAYAPSLGSSQSSAATARLNDSATTSWGYYLGGALQYFAQPEKAVLHSADSTQPGFLQALHPPAGQLPHPSGNPGSNPCFPLVPFAGLTASNLSLYQELEQKILSQERREKIYHLNASSVRGPFGATGGAAPGTASSTVDQVISATPGGMAVHLDASLKKWQSLTLGRDLGGQILQLQQVQGALKSAFQTSNQFIVISDPAVLQNVFTENQCALNGWNFDLDPSHWDRHNTILIVKYYPGLSLSELVQHTSLWQHAADFNQQDPQATSGSINTILQAAGTAQSAPDYLQHFVEITTDSNWNGVLFLNAVVPLNALPPQLEGLAAGIDPSHFFAHHLGFNLSPVHTSASGQPQIRPSAFFGLINYTASADESQVLPTGSYGFQVNELRVQFSNSQICLFQSQIQVTLNMLFGEGCTSANQSANNSIVLQGSYQDHGGQPSYTFQSKGDTLYNMNSPTLQSVDISQAQFVALQPENAWAADSLVHTRFIFAGQISFQTLAQVDLFSYDILPFQGLWLDMAFSINAPQSSRQFALDISGISLPSQGRQMHGAGSFASQFPLKLAGLVFSSGSNSQVDHGFLAAAMPDQFEGVDGAFYALLYNLDLGSMGALAPKKSFTAQLLLAWTPQPDYDSSTPATSYPAELKMHLPFAGDGKDMLNIEGILKLGIESIQLLAADGAYAIRLRNFGLHILSLTLPPSGTTDIDLFGDPSGGAGALGWYAAYNKQVSYAQDPYSS